MAKGTWKVHERITARGFGAERVPMSGAISSLKTHSDSFHEILYIESKYASTSQYVTIFNFYDRIVKLAGWRENYNANNPLYKNVVQGKIPVLGIREINKRGFLYVFHIDNLEEVYKNFKERTDEKFYYDTIIRKRLTHWKLFEDTKQKAAFENKTPIVCVKKRNRKGFLLIVQPSHLKTVFDARKF